MLTWSYRETSLDLFHLASGNHKQYARIHPPKQIQSYFLIQHNSTFWLSRCTYLQIYEHYRMVIKCSLFYSINRWCLSQVALSKNHNEQFYNWKLCKGVEMRMKNISNEMSKKTKKQEHIETICHISVTLLTHGIILWLGYTPTIWFVFYELLVIWNIIKNIIFILKIERKITHFAIWFFDFRQSWEGIFKPNL